ncbi:hypothetical protein E2C01_072731 [Portunus trituberculatus]|uniref:Uncharacterized protein n=1 Tax=Portunus trituberculatus TaxID=210409 RepID=A0A5B7I8N1_PORTR|nr:hypothetical protein [Portunus trituberculatus]
MGVPGDTSRQGRGQAVVTPALSSVWVEGGAGSAGGGEGRAGRGAGARAPRSCQCVLGALPYPLVLRLGDSPALRRACRLVLCV